jgi:magnesium chelatase family protein
MTLAHRGVLFMDELPEFDRTVLEALRQPLEDRVITISRARGTVAFPAQCILIGAMNPCPCGRGKDHGCTCLTGTLLAYKRRVSGPIYDRIDISLSVNKIDYEKMTARTSTAESSAAIRGRVIRARERQKIRFATHKLQKLFNSEMDARDLEKIVDMEPGARTLLSSLAQKHDLSGRAIHRVIKVAQTIADLVAEDVIRQVHVLEAVQYRKRIEG